LREVATEKIKLPVEARAESAPAAKTGTVIVRDGSAVLSAPQAGARGIARIAGGNASFPAEATLAEFVRVNLGGGRPGWVAAANLLPSGASGGKVSFDKSRQPPRLSVDHEGDLVTKNRSLKLTGKASDDQRIRDVYIFVGARKVFYQANPTDQKALAFAAEVPLEPGINYVNVFARENQDVVALHLRGQA
jgi:carboxyl-terminal processing protease